MSETSPQASPSLRTGGSDERQRDVLLRATRAAFVVVTLVVAFLAVLGSNTGSEGDAVSRVWLPLLVAVFIAGLFIAIDLFTPRRKLSTIAAGVVGMLAGLVAAYVVGAVIDLLVTSWDLDDQPFVPMAKILIGVCFVYLGITTVLQTSDDFRLVIPYVEFAKQIRGVRPFVIDSSALIDSRIADLAETSLVQSPLVIPQFVVSELQALADSHDQTKRVKGKRGLEVIARLQRSAALDVIIDDTPVPFTSVDQMLVELARTIPGTVVTTDGPLARIATIQGVAVVNLHDLAGALRPSAIPGDRLGLTLVKRGEQPGQGVGYLDDGTMVVVEDAAERLHEALQLTVTSSIQTAGGRLVFARIDEAAQAGAGVPEKPAGSPPARAGDDPAVDADASGGTSDGDGRPRGKRKPASAPAEPGAKRSVTPGVKPVRRATPRNPRR